MSDDFTAPYEPDPYDDRPQQNDERTIPLRPLTAAEMGFDPSKLALQTRNSGNPPPPPKHRRAILIASITSVLVLALIGIIITRSGNRPTAQTVCAACTVTAAVTATPVATHSTIATATVVATTVPTTVAATTCANIARFAQANTASTGSTNFLAAAFPPNTVAQPPVDTESDGYQIRSLPLCFPGIISSADLITRVGEALIAKSWHTAVPPASALQVCGNTGCWGQADGSTNPSTMQYISLDAITSTGSVATATMRLTISPIYTKTAVTMNSNSTFSFEQSPRAELQWDTKLHTIASNNVIGVQLAANTYATTTYAMLSQHTATFGQLTDIPIVAGSGSALQGTSGFFIKFVIQAASPGQITLNYVVYPYGF